MTEHIVLIGLMGAGKSTVGGVLAQRLRWPLRDSDREIEAATGRTVRELSAAVGVQEMHQLEAEQLLGALSEPGASVVCAAASVIDEERCRDALRTPGVLAVWLALAPASLAARFASDRHRPTFGADPATFLAAQLAAREAGFREVAALTIQTDGLTPDAIANAIITRLRAERAGR
jgi:shikimate kinase